MWTSQYERNSLISSLHFLLETWNRIDKFSQNSGGMIWIYSGIPSTTTPLSRHSTLTRSSLCWCITFCFTNATNPVSRPRPQSSCYKTANRAPRDTHHHILSASLRWKTGNLSAAICSAASRCPEASWIQGCRRECKRSKRQCDVTSYGST